MRRLAVAIGTIVICSLLISQITMAKNDNTNISYDDVYTQLEIDSTGALIVNEKIKVNVKKNQEQYIKKLDISNVSGIKDLIVSIDNAQGETIVLEAVDTIDNLHDTQFYAETFYEDRIKMNIYIPVKPYVDVNHQLNLTMQYKATDLVSIYNDAAYFEWTVLFNGEGVLRNFVLDIIYPQAINEQVNPLLNGAFYQREMTIDDWTARIISTHIEANEQVTFSVLIPAMFCLDSRKIIDSDQAEKIRSKQTQLEIEQIERQTRYLTENRLEKVLTGGPVALLVITTLFLYLIFGRPMTIKNSQPYEGKTPMQQSPAELANQSGKKVRFIDVFSTLLDLCNQSILQYKNIDGEILFVLNDIEKAQQIKRHERYLINWIFNAHDTEEVAISRVLTILERDNKTHDNARFKTWARIVRKQTEQLVKGKPNVFARVIGIAVTLINLILSTILIFRNGNILWAGATMFSSVLLVLYAYSLLNYNEEEIMCRSEWKKLIKFIRRLKKHPDKLLSYNEWEKLIPYAVSLNQEAQVVIQMNSIIDHHFVKEDAKVFKDKKDIELIQHTIKKIQRKHH